MTGCTYNLSCSSAPPTDRHPGGLAVGLYLCKSTDSVQAQTFISDQNSSTC